jgi:hypothetical protein
MEIDPLALPDDWQERAHQVQRQLKREIREFSWELAFREGWRQGALAALEKIKAAQEPNSIDPY